MTYHITETITPSVPKHLINDVELGILKQFDVNAELEGDSYNLWADTSTNEENYVDILRAVIRRSNGSITKFVIESFTKPNDGELEDHIVEIDVNNITARVK